MGHGYGDLQWQLLDILEAHEATAAPLYRGLATPALAERVHGCKPTRSKLVSLRRALDTLVRDGKVERLGFGRGSEHPYYWRRTAKERERGAVRA